MEISIIIILGVALLASLTLCGFILIVLTKSHQKEKQDLHNRLMSRDYPDYLHGEHLIQRMKEEEEKIKNKPKAEDTISAELLRQKKEASKY